jgi:sulfur-oxidizing protein SoxZ
MSDPSKIRAIVKDGYTEVRVLMAHEMESGQRHDASGKLVPAWYIHQVEASLNGRPLLKALWGPAVSKNPFLSFRFQGGLPGDVLRVTWFDTRGDQRSDEIRLP